MLPAGSPEMDDKRATSDGIDQHTTEAAAPEAQARLLAVTRDQLRANF